MNILSLFDGISCGQIALNRAGIKYDNYFASEIDKNAIIVTQSNYPATIQLGDVTKVSYKDGVLKSEHGEWTVKIDCVFGGSPCQSFSNAGNGKGFNGSSGLFYEYLRILKEVNPKYFLLENVVMKKQWETQITQLMGVEPVLIDSADFSAQSRKRLYWTNIQIGEFKAKNILIKDVIEFLPDSQYEFVHHGLSKTGKKTKNYLQCDGSGKGHNSQNYRSYYLNGKMATLSAFAPHGSKILLNDGRIRKTTQVEAERFQTIPDGYTRHIQKNKAKSAIGNGWTVDVIAHIFKGIK